MPRVDVEDDRIRRFVVRHYRYDPVRHERRHVVVGAFDNEAEFLQLLESIHDEIERRRATGAPVDRNEHPSGLVYEPGDRQRAATGHFLRKMMAHGVDPRLRIDPKDLPSNVALCGADEAADAGARRARRFIRRWLPWGDSGRRPGPVDADSDS